MRKRTVKIFAALSAMLVGLVTMPVLATPAAAAPAATQMYQIENLHYPIDGYCLDASTSNGVRLRPCDRTTFQQWYPIFNRQVILNRYDQTMCLDASVSNGVRLQPCNATSTFQQWILTSENELVLDRYSRTMCLDGSVSNGIRLRTCDGTSFQQWFFWPTVVG